MLLFQCTQAACDALTSTRKGITESWVDHEPVQEADACWVWQLHAVKINRKLVFVVMECETRFAMVFWGLKKGDGETLIALFFERLVNHLLYLAQASSVVDASVARAMIDRLLETNRAFKFQPGGDRSVQTHINDVAHLCRFDVGDYDCFPDNRAEAAGFEVKLNQTLRSVHGSKYFQPDVTLCLKCLQAFAGFEPTRLQQVADGFQAMRHHQWATLMQEDGMRPASESNTVQSSKGRKTLH